MRMVQALMIGVVALCVAPGLAHAQTTPVAHVESIGDGPIPLVLVPGLGCDWTVWRAFMDRNADRYTMRAVTLPGFAGTDSPPAPASDAGTPWLDNAVAAVAEVIGEGSLDGAVVVGHSLGGLVAYRLAVERPDMIRAAIAVDAPPAIPFGDRALSPEDRAALVDEMVRPAIEALTDDAWTAQQRSSIEAMVRNPVRAGELVEMNEQTPREVGLEYMVEVFKTDLRPALEGARTPVLAIAAIARDGANQSALRDIWAEQVGPATSVQLVFIEDSRHFVMDDQPEALDRAIAAFVESQKNGE